MARREATAREFAESLWALASLDASQASQETKDAVVPNLGPGKQPEGRTAAPVGPRRK